MKKLLLVLLIVLLSILAGSYIFISDKIEISKVAMLDVNKRAAYRCFTESNLLQDFLKDSQQQTSTDTGYLFKHNDVSFQFKQRMFDLVEVPITYKGLNLNSFISFMQPSQDSCGVTWRTALKMSSNPFKRIQQYLQVKKIHKTMGYILDLLTQFTANKKNIYGLQIERTTVTDSLLVTSKFTSEKYPTEETYYASIKELQQFISANGATAANYPMLNVTAIDSNRFEVTVAVPVSKEIPGSTAIFFKRMFPGNILTAEVKGGTGAVEEGFRQLNNYVSDYGLVPPAIPFQSLVTDRSIEKDSSKWITKLYYPIF